MLAEQVSRSCSRVWTGGELEQALRSRDCSFGVGSSSEPEAQYCFVFGSSEFTRGDKRGQESHPGRKHPEARIHSEAPRIYEGEGERCVNNAFASYKTLKEG